MRSFIPPSFNLPLAWSVDFSFPWLLKWVFNIQDVIISHEDQVMIRSLRRERMIYLSNHPSTSEPPVAYHVANVMGSRFKFMAARGVFEWGAGAVGRVIQGLGAYSVVAGAPDRESLKASRAILASPAGKLVLYPEGEPTSGENDNLLPFQPGIAQLGFWAMDDIRKEDPEANITVLPAFVKYVYIGTDAKIKSELFSSLRRIERRYRIDPGNKNLLRRFLTIGRIFLEDAESRYKIPRAGSRDWEYRIGRVRHAILDGVAERLAVPGYDGKADAITKLRYLLAMLELIELKMDVRDIPDASEADLKWAHRECQRAYDVIVMKPDYLVTYPSAERFFEYLARYETYTFGSTNARPRNAHVFFARPFQLSEFYTTDKSQKKAALEACVARMRKEIELLRDEAQKLTRPIVRPYDVGDEGL